MKKFGKLIIIFLFPIVSIGLVIELLERNIPNSYTLKNQVINEKAENIKTLILGSSHSYYGLNPEFFSHSTFNFAGVSQTIDIDKNVLKTYLQKLPKLENVVIRLSYTTLYEQLKHTSEAWRIKDYEIYTDVRLSNQLKYKSEVLTMKLENNLEDIYKFYIKKEDLLNTDSLGWGSGLKGEFKGNKQEIGKVIAKKHTIKDKKYFQENLAFLKEIIKICSDKNINVILVTFPAYKSYVENLEEDQLQQTIYTGRILQDKYKNCYYYNFLKDKLFKKEDFYDVDHLNHKGAKKLSLKINRIIEQNSK